MEIPLTSTINVNITDEDCGCWNILTESEGIMAVPENDYDILLIIKE